MDMLLAGLVVLQVLCLGAGSPSGAPGSACEDMMPRHGVQAQTTTAPYMVQVLTSNNTFQAGQPLNVTITGPDYKGVLLEARTDTSSNALGSWQSPPPDTKFLQCAGNPRGAITHANTNPKGNTTVFSWMPPSAVSSIYFRVTVAQERTVYWLNLRSVTLTKGAAGGIEPAPGGHPGMTSGGFLLLLAPCLLVSSG